jgi:CRISPR-associated protein Cmr1
MSKEYRLHIKTPLWTGDIDSKSDSLQSTGIIGSLRWWMEAVLRGMDKFACGPVGDERCPEESSGSDKKINQYCSACLIFGATGLRRLFRMEMGGGSRLFDGGAINIRPDKRNRGWYLGSGLVGEICLKTIALDKDFHENLVLIPLTTATIWAGIGAKTQHGYGVVELKDRVDLNFDEFKKGIEEKITAKDRLSSMNMIERKGSNKDLPNIKEMFFAKVQFEVQNGDWWKKVDGIRPDNTRNYRGYVNDPRMLAWINSDSVPIAPAIKNWLRYGNGTGLWKSSNQNQDRRIENLLFGTIKNDKLASKVNISCAYKVKDNLWEFRIWGWIPNSDTPDGFKREDFLNSLKQALSGGGSVTIPWTLLLGDQTSNHKLSIWREFNSPRDTVRSNESNMENYLQSLLKNEGDTQ